MNIQKSDIVRATAGRDMGKYFFVTDIDETYALIADGMSRKLEKPKRKKLKHLLLASHTDDLRTAEKIRSGDRVSNSELRRALADFAARPDGEQGGM